ncbi:MAG: 50S ribosomal protein L6 [Gammaproteobacteria bacterium]
MSRIAKLPVSIPSGVQVTFANQMLTIKGPKGQVEQPVHEFIDLSIDDKEISVKLKEDIQPRRDQKHFVKSIPGTVRALVNNMVTGVSEGFEKKLSLVGVGYRAEVKGNALGLALGFSHPVNHPIPEGITIETPEPATILVKGIDKQLVGQTAAEIRAYRPPEPYKGKGVRYADEYVRRKETKKK